LKNPVTTGICYFQQAAGNGKTGSVQDKLLIPYRPFEYHFLDEDFNSLYSSELRLGKVLTIFASIAIILACLGLLGLSSYSAKQRIKEIGIRKVMGASVSSVVMLLSRDFTRLVIISFVLAAPLSWWMMDSWLGGFAYRIPLGVDSFLVAGLLAFAIAGLTVSYQSIKAALANPVNSLRSE